jgi:hypothetical protein
MTFKQNKVVSGTLVGRGNVSDLIKDLQSIPATSSVEGDVSSDEILEYRADGDKTSTHFLEWNFDVTWSDK